jgi:hypothetical protein
MPRTQVRKMTPTNLAVGGARPANYVGNDMRLHGYWLNDTRPVMVEVPIFQHAFYPKLDHTDLDIKQNLTYRTVKVPSMAELRANGIDTTRAVFVAEVVVHPRYIKHNNYFRSDFPANVKSLAKRDGVTFIFPANDMPSARFKRKFVLNFWRQSFTPLLIKGRQYTSGRMNMFVVAPPEATTRLKASFNFEGKEEKATLVEGWHPSLNKPSRTRGRRPPHTRVRQPLTREQEYLSSMIVQDTAERMKKDLLPIITSQLHIKDPHVHQELEDYVSSPATSRELLRASNKPNKSEAIKRWVTQRFLPRVKEIVVDEVAMASETVGRFVIRAVISTTLADIVDRAKNSEAPKMVKAREKMPWISRVNFDPSELGSAMGVAGGTLSYNYARTPAQLSEMATKIQQFIFHQYVYHSGDPVTEVGKQFFKVKINPNSSFQPVQVSMDYPAIDRVTRVYGEASGWFKTRFKEKGSSQGYAKKVEHTLLPQLQKEAIEFYKANMAGAEY